MLLCKTFGSTTVARRVQLGVPMKLFALHDRLDVRAGTATVSEAGATSDTEAVRSVQNQDLPHKKVLYLVLICNVATADSAKGLVSLHNPHKWWGSGCIGWFVFKRALCLGEASNGPSFKCCFQVESGSSGRQVQLWNEITGAYHPARSVNCGWPVAIRSINGHNSSFKQVWLPVVQIANLPYPL